MIEYRVTNGRVERLYQEDNPLYAVLDFERRYGILPTATAHRVTDYEVKPMPVEETILNEQQIVPNFWNFCKVCKLQTTTVHRAKACGRCQSMNLVRRPYCEPKSPDQSEAKRGDGQGNLHNSNRTEEGRLREYQAAN